MKFFSKKAAAVAAGLVLSGASAFAAHVPGFGFNAETFFVNPTVVGEPFAQFTAGAINFSYTAEIDQFAGSGTPAASAFNETGFIDFGAFLVAQGGTPIGALDTGLNLSSSSTAGYSLYALFTAAGTATASGSGINGTFSSFDVTIFVDGDNNTTFGSGTDAPGEGTTRTRTGGFGEDLSVLTGTLQIGGFHASPGLLGGDFDVVFNVTSFGERPGFFSTTTDGQPLTQGDFSGVNSAISGGGVPPAAFTDATITGSGNLVFQSVPEPTSLALVGLALVGIGAARRRKA